MPVYFDENKLADCLCEDCPTYPKATFPKAEGVFCAVGREGVIYDRKGCLCKHCSVYESCGISGSYFCIDGPAD